MSKKKIKLPTEVGQTSTFTGFTGPEEDNPDFAEHLVKGEDYEVGLITKGEEATEDEEGIEDTYTLLVTNPDYDPDKRKSKNNMPMLGVVVFPDELKLAKEQAVKEADPAKQTTKPTAKKTPAKKTAAEKETTAPKAKAKPKAETKAAPETKAKPEAKVEEVPTKSADKDLLVLTAEEEDEDILELCSESEDICALAKEAAQDSALSDYRLGGILYHVRLSGAYQEQDERYAGKKGFGLWSEEELGIKYRKAMYLTDIYTKFSKFGIDSSKVAELGWTKCMEVARVMTSENAEELIELADDSTVEDLKETIRETYTGETTSKPAVKKVRFKFALEQDAGTVVAELFGMATESLGLDHDNDVFEHIITEWAAEHLEVAKPKKSKKTKKSKA